MSNLEIFEARPFKIRNAEEFDFSSVLDVFVNPLISNRNPFEYENAIVKGGMGSGKSMYLRANYAFHFYSIVPSLIRQQALVLPVMIRLSDFQHLRDSQKIYSAVIRQIVKGIASVFTKLQNADELCKIHTGMKSLPNHLFDSARLGKTIEDLVLMEAEEYRQTVTKELGGSGKVGPKFMEAGLEFKRKGVQEVSGKKAPGISDVHDTYERLLGEFQGSILLLIDEAGSLDKSFFRDENDTSLFEVLMNQLRTAEYLRAKIAVYPHSYSDILVETRYGDLVHLSEDVVDEGGYARFRERSLSIMDKYIGNVSNNKFKVFDVFNVSPRPDDVGDALEQIVYSSRGNVRRLLLILDTCMQEACATQSGKGKVEMEHAIEGLKKHSASAESVYTSVDRQFLEMLAKVCRSRSTHRFRFPHKSPMLSKYITKSEEHNVLTVCEAGAGRRGTTYEFDYAFCVRHDVPTHYVRGTERIDRSRSRRDGTWITRVTQVSEEILVHAQIPGKIEGTVDFLKGEHGFVKTDNGKEYFISCREIIETDKGKQLVQGRRVRFYPAQYENALLAYAVEIL